MIQRGLRLEAGWILGLSAACGGLLREASNIECMVIDINEAQVCTLEQVRQVLARVPALEFRRTVDDVDRYAGIEQVL
jgi:hypothetical protein